MITRKLSVAELEEVYDAIADAVDEAPEDKRLLFLAKLALTLASQLGDAAKVSEAIAAAARDL